VPKPPKIAIVGSVGLPPRYGGFETLAAALIQAAAAEGMAELFTVYCSAPQSAVPRPSQYHGAALRYLPIRANGAQSILYDTASLIDAARSGADRVLLLGVSGAVALPMFRRVSKAQLVVHPDGIEWRRDKWSSVARKVLHWSEQRAIACADTVISDNPAITRYLQETYAIEPVEIAYGGDQAQHDPPGDISALDLPADFALTIARIEPDNQIELILDAFAALPAQHLVVVGNWDHSSEALRLRARYANVRNLHLLDPIHDQSRLRALRERATFYIHGHSAGGTNPGLVEAMHAGLPIAAFDCVFNRATTENAAVYFTDQTSLRALVPALTAPDAAAQGARLADIAQRNYRWSDVTAAYFAVLGLPTSGADAAKASPGAPAPL